MNTASAITIQKEGVGLLFKIMAYHFLNQSVTMPRQKEAGAYNEVTNFTAASSSASACDMLLV